MSALHPRPWRRNSLFGNGPRHPLDREQRARFRFLARAHRAGRRISACAHDVSEALIRRLGTDGQLDPSHATIAADATCSVRTVQRALSALRAYGLLSWQRRIARCRDGRIEQVSSQFWLSATAAATVPTPCGHFVRQIREVKNKPAFEHAATAAAAVGKVLAGGCPDLLTARRLVIEARLVAGGFHG
jgi:hypothetical protein